MCVVSFRSVTQLQCNENFAAATLFECYFCHCLFPFFFRKMVNTAAAWIKYFDLFAMDLFFGGAEGGAKE